MRGQKAVAEECINLPHYQQFLLLSQLLIDWVLFLISPSISRHGCHLGKQIHDFYSTK